LHRRFEVPTGDPRAAVILIHGLSEHTHLLSWNNACEALVAGGLVVAGFDLRGHGRSPGLRGHIDRWQTVRDDLLTFRSEVHWRWPDLPLFLVGLSLGGLIVLDSALVQPDGLAGVIAVGAPVGKVGVPVVVRVLARVLSRVKPETHLKLGINLARLSRDWAQAEACVADPGFHRHVTARGVTEGFQAIAHLKANAASLRVPLLLLHGSDDVISTPGPDFFAAVGSADKTHTVYPGALHNLFIETNRDEVMMESIEWIIQRS
jgi:alpha-beta hydrolase superfamily lysophospholipase